MPKTKRKKPDTSWIWMTALTGIALIYAIVFIAGRLINGQTQVNGQAQINGRTHPGGHKQSPPLQSIQDKYSPPTLKSLIVNSDSSQNYFDFILDRGDHEDTNTKISDNGQNDNGQGQALSLQPIARDLINYFFLGITLPPDDFWVNLNPTQPERITNPTLGKTDIAKILLEADLRMKKDVARFTDPRTPMGAEYWKKLNRELRKKGVFTPQIPGGNRVWIVPDKAVVEENQETNKVTIVNSRLKVLLESEYFNRQTHLDGRTHTLTGTSAPPLQFSQQGHRQGLTFQAADPTSQAIQDIASRVMKEVIIPTLEHNINHAKPYAQLRQVYTSLILSAYFKQKYKNDNSFYSQIINKGYLGSLKSTKPWSKQKIFDAYIQSAQQGEHSLTQAEYDPYTSQLVQKQYFSGGVRLAPEQVLKIRVQESASPLSSQDSQGDIFVKVSSPIDSEQLWRYDVTLLPRYEETPLMVVKESSSPLNEKDQKILNQKIKELLEDVRRYKKDKELQATAEEFEQIYPKLQRAAELILERYQKLAQELELNPGNVRIYMVGGRLRMKELKVKSGIDLIVAPQDKVGTDNYFFANNRPGEVRNDDLRMRIKKIFFDVSIELAIPNRFGIANIRWEYPYAVSFGPHLLLATTERNIQAVTPLGKNEADSSGSHNASRGSDYPESASSPFQDKSKDELGGVDLRDIKIKVREK